MEPFWVVSGIVLLDGPNSDKVSFDVVFLDTTTNKFGSILNATLFGEEGKADQVADDTEGKYTWKGIVIEKLGATLLLSKEVTLIQKHQLKKRAKVLYGLRVNSPTAIIADRYEDEGMMQEASLLRS